MCLFVVAELSGIVARASLSLDRTVSVRVRDCREIIAQACSLAGPYGASATTISPARHWFELFGRLFCELELK